MRSYLSTKGRVLHCPSRALVLCKTFLFIMGFLRIACGLLPPKQLFFRSQTHTISLGLNLIDNLQSRSDTRKACSSSVSGGNLWRRRTAPTANRVSAALLHSNIDVTEESLMDDEITLDSDMDEDELETMNLPKGTIEGFYIVRTYKCDDAMFDMNRVQDLVGSEDVERLELTKKNISVPVALMLLDEHDYPSRSRARKACRKGNVMVHRGPIQVDPSTGSEVFDSSKSFCARVGDRVFPGDVIGRQVRMGDGYFPVMNHKKPPFDLPVVYEDDHFAICNKPAGVVVYANRGGGHGIMTVRAALPFSVQPPAPGTVSTLRRPQPVHRLDKPTSGLLLVAKTKPAMVNLSEQFRDRKVKKTYTAVVNGIPPENKETMISSQEATSLGVDVTAEEESTKWQLIDYPLDEKHAITIWRSLQYAKSLKASDNYVTLVELKPKTGRYHQLRRHMSWVCEAPIIGDSTYDGGGPAMQLRGNGLFLCSNKVTLEHPFYNSRKGQEEFAKLESQPAHLWVSKDGKVMVSAAIELPEKFESFMSREQDRFERLSNEATSSDES